MKTKIFLFMGILAGLALPSAVLAATLSLSPSSGSVASGQTVSVTVFVSSSDHAMNAVSGVVSFPTDKLEAVSVSKASSIATLWVQEPSFSNSAGTVSFEGVAPNPGFTGTSGKVVTITFRGKAEGVAKLSFASGSVLANDGKGTELYSGSNGTTITIGGFVPSPVPVTPRESAPAPSAQKGVTITSPTHPDQSKSYADRSPQFVWTLPAGATEVRTLIDESPNATPSVRYTPPISKKTVEDLSDGIYYFSVQVRTGEGWGAVSRFQVTIDTTLSEEEPVLADIHPPQISEYTETLLMGEPLKINGTTYPNAVVDITVSKDGSPMLSKNVRSDSAGAFGAVVPERLWPGAYTFTARVTDSVGVQSAETGPYAVTVRFYFFTDAIAFILNYFFIMLSLLVAVGLIAAAGIWSWFTLLRMTRVLQKESIEAQSMLHRSFKVLRGDLAEHIKKLHKARKSRTLTEEELEFLEQFGNDLSEAEQIIAKEVADISAPKRKRRLSKMPRR